MAEHRLPGFVPPPWLSSGHAQTLVVPAFRAPAGDPGARVQIPVDGGTLVGRLDRAECTAGHHRRAALVLHGLNGSADEGFVVRTGRKLATRGIDALRLSLRGAGESRGCTPPMFHSGLTDDVRRAVAWLAARYDRVGMAGFSLGGQLVLRTLGEWGADAPAEVRVAVTVSAPLDLARTADFSNTVEASPYRWYVVHGLRTRYAALRGVLPAAIARAGVDGVRTIRGYDDRVVAPLHGFTDAADYYARCSAAAVLGEVVVPTVVIHAEDDPLVPVGPVEAARATASARVRFVVTRRGGHVGYLAARCLAGDPDRFWAENRIAAILDAVL